MSLRHKSSSLILSHIRNTKPAMSSPILTVASASCSNANNTSISHGKLSRDPSFSSYLNTADESLVVKLRGGTTIRHDHDDCRDEIDVFGAEKYFNEGYCTNNIITLHNSDLKRDEPPATFVRPAPSTHSELSWNSRQSLLNQRPQRTTRKKNFLARIIGRSCCSCRGKNNNSVIMSTNPKLDDKRPKVVDKSSHKLQQETYFSFPVFNPKTSDHQVNVLKPDHGLISRRDKKLSMPILDAADPNAARRQDTKLTMTASDIIEKHDSDASSSDLFEIETLSDGCIMSPARPRGGGYAPSERSIEWSVVTADVSVFSDSDSDPDPPRVARWHSTILAAACSNHKAVSVAGAGRTYSFPK